MKRWTSCIVAFAQNVKSKLKSLRVAPHRLIAVRVVSGFHCRGSRGMPAANCARNGQGALSAAAPAPQQRKRYMSQTNLHYAAFPSIEKAVWQHTAEKGANFSGCPTGVCVQIRELSAQFGQLTFLQSAGGQSRRSSSNLGQSQMICIMCASEDKWTMRSRNDSHFM